MEPAGIYLSSSLLRAFYSYSDRRLLTGFRWRLAHKSIGFYAWLVLLQLSSLKQKSLQFTLEAW
jgi:hypothetical protein